MKEKTSIFLKWGVIGNGMHVTVAALNTFIEKENLPMMMAMTFLAMGVWFAAGFMLGKSRIKNRETDFLIFGIICILPALIYVIGAQGMQSMSESLTTVQNYNLFYFVGAPILFWNSPFYPIMNLFPDSNIYIQININLIFVVFVVFMGAYLGKAYKISRIKKKRNKIKYADM
ncbi:hypothetical protein [Alkalibacter saccharofermentans]|uniref:Uncharacterized protein n=1 Tax=Alkalibacter saccharofermentans DSM 14828 TaxID=1120975 RepID=A0A1M4T5E2_9FIRM|nr:hypothetical protein [Alkalibacter saccharofermentans]SHE39610.1 hypothetical protein SAMN02746064_00384 [Alkalibacter saccharofermentans DSM 14828]